MKIDHPPLNRAIDVPETKEDGGVWKIIRSFAERP
jgi:hypothetical protein